MTQISLKIDDEEKHKFEATTKKLGFSTTSALKMLIAKFNREGSFDFTVTLSDKAKLPMK